jgi:hypothetical protein
VQGIIGEITAVAIDFALRNVGAADDSRHYIFISMGTYGKSTIILID